VKYLIALVAALWMLSDAALLLGILVALVMP
jgi:hypothetical protein